VKILAVSRVKTMIKDQTGKTMGALVTASERAKPIRQNGG